MSTPMFIREPKVGPASLLNLNTRYYLFEDVEEATLVEEIQFTAITFSTDAGRIVLYLEDSAFAGTFYACGAFEIPAGTASLEASERIPVNITIPVGWSLMVASTVQLTGAGGSAQPVVVALGGIVR